MINKRDRDNLLIIIKIVYKHKIKLICFVIFFVIYYFNSLSNKYINDSNLSDITFSTVGRYRVEIYDALNYFTNLDFPKYNIFVYDNINNKLLYSFYELQLYESTVYWGGSSNNDTGFRIGLVLNVDKLDPDKCIGFTNCTELTNFLKRKQIYDANNIEKTKNVPNKIKLKDQKE